MEGTTTSKEMLLRMIVRCAKVRKHKPRSVETPALKVSAKGVGIESVLFADSEIKHGKNWGRPETAGIRKAFRNMNSNL